MRLEPKVMEELIWWGKFKDGTAYRLFAVFNQISSENSDQIAERKDVKSTQLGGNRRMHTFKVVEKVGARQPNC